MERMYINISKLKADSCELQAIEEVQITDDRSHSHRQGTITRILEAEVTESNQRNPHTTMSERQKKGSET